MPKWISTAMACIFALGFGIAVAQSNQACNWWIEVLGLCSPPIVYFAKYLATHLLPMIGFKPPFFLMLFYYSPAEFYIPKIALFFVIIETIKFPPTK